MKGTETAKWAGAGSARDGDEGSDETTAESLTPAPTRPAVTNPPRPVRDQLFDEFAVRLAPPAVATESAWGSPANGTAAAWSGPAPRLGPATRRGQAAVREARARLRVDASDLPARLVLAAHDLCNDRPGDCVRRLERPPAALESDADANRLAGYAALAMARPVTANTFFRRAIRITPHRPDVWVRLGQLYEAWGQDGTAIAYYQRGQFFEGRHHESTLALTRLLLRHRKRRSAASALRDALARDRRSPILNAELARVCVQLANRARRLGNSRRSRRLMNEAVFRQSTTVAANGSSRNLVRLAKLADRAGRFDLAHRSLSRAIEIDPGDLAALTKLACLNVDEGNLTLAENQFRQVLASDPDSPTAHFRFSRIRKACPCGEDRATVARLRRSVEGSRWPRSQRIRLRFALGKMLDDLGEYDEAWHHYDLANRAKSEHSSEQDRPDRVESLRRSSDERMERFTPEFFAERSGWGSDSRTPVFVVGMPRSGTTLVEQILSSHPEIAGAGELPDIEQLRHQVGFDHRSTQAKRYHRGDVSVVGEIGRPRFREAADAYLERIAQEANGQTRRVVDKMPTNFLNLGWIATLFPNATVIRCRRNPLDVFVSCYCQNLNAPFCDLQILPEYEHGYRRLMGHWESALPIRIQTVDYESLVSDPEPNIRALVDACGVPWDPACLDFQNNRRAVRTPSKWQVRQPMYRSSIDRWRRFERHLTGVIRHARRLATTPVPVH